MQPQVPRKLETLDTSDGDLRRVCAIILVAGNNNEYGNYQCKVDRFNNIEVCLE